MVRTYGPRRCPIRNSLSNFISRPPQSPGRSAPQTVDSSSKNVVNFSSASAAKRFPSSRCASTIQIVRPLLRRSPSSDRLYLERDYLVDTRAPGPEESSQVNLFHLCFGCGAQIERMQGQIETIPPCVLLGRVPITAIMRIYDSAGNVIQNAGLQGPHNQEPQRGIGPRAALSLSVIEAC